MATESTSYKPGLGKKPKDPSDKIENLNARFDAMCENLKIGMSMTDAARAIGVNPRTAYAWLEKEKKGLAGYEGLADKFDMARADGQRTLAKRIYNASLDDWKAAGWILERRHPESWKSQTSITVGGGEKPIEIEGNLNLTVKWDERCEARLAELLAKRQTIEGLKNNKVLDSL